MAFVRLSTALYLLSAIILAGAPSALGHGGGGGPGGGEDGGYEGGGSQQQPGDLSSSTTEDLTTECDHEGLNATYTEVLMGEGSTTIRQSASETGCSNHINYGINPFPGRFIPSNTSIPAYPMLQASNASTDLSETPGQVGTMVNGVAMFSAWTRDAASSYETTAFYLEGDTLDACGAHATTEGWYHYHSAPGCLQEHVMEVEGISETEHSPRLGWSWDGFPIYGQLGVDGVEMKLCGGDGSDETYCLDTCSGFEMELPGIDDFKYRYYLTCGYDESFYPFTVNCYRGCCPTAMTCSGSAVEECTTEATAGTTDDYEPEVGLILTEPYDTIMLEGDDTYYLESNTTYDCALLIGSASINDSSPTPAPVSNSAPTASALEPIDTPIGSASGSTRAPVESGASSSLQDQISAAVASLGAGAVLATTMAFATATTLAATALGL